MLDSNFLHEYPYTDYHELNTDWIINEVEKIKERIEALIKKIDDLIAKQKALDEKVDDVVKHVDDVKNQVDHKIADVTKHVDDVEKKVDNIKTEVDNQEQKITDAQNKATENQTKINDSVKSVTYENDMNISDANVKLIGRIHVTKPDTGDVSTPIYGYVGGGVLGNCVVWSKTPYVGIGEQKDYIMKNPRDNTLMEFPINGSFFAICGKGNHAHYAIITNGSLSHFYMTEKNKYLITPDSFVCVWTEDDQTNDTRIIIPKVASGIRFEDAKYPYTRNNPVSIPYNKDHLYIIQDSYSYFAYVVNESVEVIVNDDDVTFKIENNTMSFTNKSSTNKVMMLDLGSMV